VATTPAGAGEAAAAGRTVGGGGEMTGQSIWAGKLPRHRAPWDCSRVGSDSSGTSATSGGTGASRGGWGVSGIVRSGVSSGVAAGADASSSGGEVGSSGGIGAAPAGSAPEELGLAPASDAPDADDDSAPGAAHAIPFTEDGGATWASCSPPSPAASERRRAGRVPRPEEPSIANPFPRGLAVAAFRRRRAPTTLNTTAAISDATPTAPTIHTQAGCRLESTAVTRNARP
jgi:hypothetical protein